MITSEKTKTVISLSDHEIRYVTIAKNKKGFYIKKFDSAELEEGIIKDGEILKADFLRKILLNIAKKINISSRWDFGMHLQLTFYPYFVPDGTVPLGTKYG